MKQTRTTLKELTAAYRAVLRHGILCNAIALGLIAATPAMAETITERQVLNGGVDVELTDVTASDINAGSAYGAAYYIDNLGGTVTVSGSEFSGNVAATSGAMEICEGVLNINGSTFTGNSATTSSGAIETWTRNNVLSINNSTFTENYAPTYGTISVFGKTDVNTINGSTFTGNRATATEEGGNDYDHGDAGAVYLGSEGKLKITDTEFDSNYAGIDGGAIATRNEHQNQTTAGLEIVGSTFTENTAGQRGGAIYANISHNTTLDGAASIVDSEFESNGAVKGGAIYNDKQDSAGNTSTLSISGSTFTENTATQDGGAIYSMGTLTLNDVEFDGNTAVNQGGAVFNYGELNIDGATFTSNKTTSIQFPSQGGAIFNSGDYDYLDVPSITANISNTTFGDKNDAAKGNQALQGGAIANESDLIDGEVTLTNVNFYNNKAFADTDDTDGHESSLGGAIWNQGIMTVNGDTEFVGNKAEGYNVEGGAIYNSGSLTFNDEVTFDSNTSTDINSGNGAFGGAISTGWTSETVFKKNAVFTGNKALSTAEKGTQGGAIFNGNIVTFEKGATFSENEAVYGGAVFNDDGTMTITDGTFTNNTAGDEGGAIFNYGGTVNLNAVNSDVVFSGNTANDVANDITNYGGTINLNAAEGREISFDGGIDGVAGTMNITGAGIVDLSTIKNHTVSVNAGELWLSNGAADGSNIAGSSTVAVNTGATLNSIDDLINSYSGITLNDGASFGLDIDFDAGDYDRYNIADNAHVTLSKVNMLSALNNGVSERALNIALNDKGNIAIDSSVTDSVKAYTSAGEFSLLGNGSANDGTISLTKINDNGGLDTAVDNTDTNADEAVVYQVTANETFTNGADTTIARADFIIHGGDKTITSDGAEGIKVANDSSLEVDNLTLSSFTGAAIENQGGDVSLSNVTFDNSNALAVKNVGFMEVKDSKFYAAVLNQGTYESDPTDYYDTFTNTAGATASFDEDTFHSAASLANDGTASFANGVTFDAGATITGDGVVNMLSGTTHFNDTASSNTLKLANGAKFDGTIVSTGTVDTRNGNIEEAGDLGAVSGGDLYVDANLVAGEVDTFASTTGANVKGIKLANAGYGTADKVELDVGDATLDSNLEVEGTNYYTSVTKDGDNIVFSDKLINESNMYNKLGSWSSGNYIKNSTGYGVGADATHLTVGQALTALDTAIGSMSGFGSQHYATNTGSVAANLTALDTAVYTNAGNIATNAGNIATNTADIATNAGNIATNTAAIATLNGTGAGSVSNSVKVGAEGADFTNAGTSAALGTATTVGGAINSVAAATDANTAALATITGTGAGSVSKTVTDTAENGTYTGAQVNGATGAATIKSALAATNTQVDANTAALATLNGTGAGSVSNSVKVGAEGADFTNAGTSAALGTAATVGGAINSVAAATDANTLAIGNMASLSGTHVSSTSDVVTNLNQLSAAIDAVGTGSLAAANTYTDQRVESMDKNLSAGVAGAVALSSVAVSGVERGEVSVGAGYGYFNGQSAAAFGAAMGLSNRWSVNAGAGVSNADVSFRAGTNYKFKLF